MRADNLMHLTLLSWPFVPRLALGLVINLPPPLSIYCIFHHQSHHSRVFAILVLPPSGLLPSDMLCIILSFPMCHIKFKIL